MPLSKTREKPRRTHNANLPRRLQVEFMSEEYMTMYNAFCSEVLDEWQPEGAIEKNLVRTLADLKWHAELANSRKRLVYAKALTGEPLQIAQVKVLSEIQRHFSKYHINYQDTLRQLKAVQARRKAAQQSKEQS